MTSVDPADADLRHRLRPPQGRRRQRHPAAEGRRHRRAGGRRRPHRLVPGRAGRLRIDPAARHPCAGRCRHHGRHAQVGLRRQRPGQGLRGGHRRAAGRRASPVDPILINTCYSLVAPDYGISVAGVYRPDKGVLADIPGAGGTSPLEVVGGFRGQEALYADELVQDDHCRDLRLSMVRAGLLGVLLAAAGTRPGAEDRALRRGGRCHSRAADRTSRAMRRAAGRSSPTAASAFACSATAARSPRSVSRAPWRPASPEPARAGRWASSGCASSTARVSIPTRSCRPITGPTGLQRVARPSRARPS